MLPPELIDAFREGRAAVFFGAGASMAAGLPSWDELIGLLAGSLRMSVPNPPYSADLLLKVPQYYVNKSDSKRDLNRLIEKMLEDGKVKFRKAKPKLLRPIHHYLAQLPTKLFYTTNFDKFLEEELEAQGIDFEVVDSEKMARQLTERRKCQVRKIHGSIGGDWDDLVLTRGDFANLPNTRPVLFQALGVDLISHVFLFLGYSLRDPDFSSVYNNYFAGMKGKHQAHFLVLLEDPGALETEDLHRRGLMPIEGWSYPGGSKTEKLIAFLKSLVDAASEQTRLRRFYHRLERHAHIPIVVTSDLHPVEQYVTYPACDIDLAHQISADMQKLSVTPEIVSDVRALGDPEQFLSDHLILICSPLGNKFTKHVFEKASQKNSAIRQRFISMGGKRRAIVANGIEYPSDDPSESGVKERIEHALIARYLNPWAPGKYIYVFAGVQALGTVATRRYLSQSAAYSQLAENADDGDIVAILPVKYREYDPYDPQFELGEMVRIVDFN